MCDKCWWLEVLNDIEEKLNDGEYDFAREELLQIKTLVGANKHIAESQYRALVKISIKAFKPMRN